MMVRSRESGVSGQKLLLILLYFMLAGCAAVKQPVMPSEAPPPAAAVTGDDIIKGINGHREKVHALKGMATVRVVTKGKDTAVKEVLVIKAPEKIRAETIGIFGSPVFVLATDGSMLNTLIPAENRFTAEELSFRRGPFPFDILGTKDLAALLLGSTPIIKYGGSALEYSDAERVYKLTLRSMDGFKRQTIIVDAATLQLKNSEIADAERGAMVYIDFNNYQDVGGITFPKGITVDFFPGNDRFSIGYEDIELNPELSDELFVLSPPEKQQ